MVVERKIVIFLRILLFRGNNFDEVWFMLVSNLLRDFSGMIGIF